MDATSTTTETAIKLKHPKGPWEHVPDEQWNDWHWQTRNRIRTLEELAKYIQMPEAELELLKPLGKLYKFAITPYYFNLIDAADPHDPIRRMMLPSVDELDDSAELVKDPLGERDDMPVRGLVHRYPDRVLFITTSYCSSYCRFCTRKRNWEDSDAAVNGAYRQEAIDYIRAHPEIRDVIVSGGDPLTLATEALEEILSKLREIPHVEIIRIHSREPVQMPQRITERLASTLAKYHPIWFNTHFNHPREVTPEAAKAVDTLLRQGIPVGNQSVLMRGVNDDVATMKALCHALVKIRVRPYYLYNCDPVAGTSHLRTSPTRGIEIIEGMRGHTSGLAIPQFVVDAPGGGGKIPVMPQYIVSQGPDHMTLRNFEWNVYRYDDPERGNRAAASGEQLTQGHGRRGEEIHSDAARNGNGNGLVVSHGNNGNGSNGHNFLNTDGADAPARGNGTAVDTRLTTEQRFSVDGV